MNVNTSAYRYFMANFGEKKDFPAVAFLHKTLTYGALSQEIDRVACFLLNLGVKKGDCVTIALPNVPSAVSVFYAVNKIGAVANMAHPLLPFDLLKKYMQAANSKLLFGFDILIDEYFDKLIADGFKVVVCRANDYLNCVESFFYSLFGKKRYKQIDKKKCVFFKQAQKTQIFAVSAAAAFDNVAVIMHSSGTTQEPKTTALTDKNLNVVADNTIDVLPWKKQMKRGMASLMVLPSFHAFGLGVCVHTVMSYGYLNVLVPKFSPKAIVRKLKTKNIAVIAGVPTMFLALAKQKNFGGKHLKRLAFAFCGGDRLDDSVRELFDGTVAKWGGKCKLDEGYGLTEAAGVFSVNTRRAEKAGSLGKPLGGEIFAFDEDGNVLPAGQDGELCVSSAAVMKGYLKDGKIVRDGLFMRDGKTFVKTGDLGHVDEEGFIFYKSRIKRMEKVSGINVFPAEAEKTIGKVDGVLQCCVKGVPDEKKGTVLHAYVVPQEGADQDALRAAIQTACAEKLDKWTCPRQINFLREMPLNKFGKIDYDKL